MIVFLAILAFLFAIISVFITLAAVISALPLMLIAALLLLLHRFTLCCIRVRSVV